MHTPDLDADRIREHLAEMEQALQEDLFRRGLPRLNEVGIRETIHEHSDAGGAGRVGGRISVCAHLRH
jgi:hypothetical protein